MRKSAVIILVLEALLLVFAIAVFLAGENENVEQPTSVPVAASVAKPPRVSVPVSVNLRAKGTATTAAFATRGGQALPTP